MGRRVIDSYHEAIWARLDRFCGIYGASSADRWASGSPAACFSLCTGQFQNRASPRANPGAFDFFEKFWSGSRYIARLDGQMPHPLELQRGTNRPPSRHAKATVETSSAKFSATTNFLFSLSSLQTLNKGIFHDKTI